MFRLLNDRDLGALEVIAIEDEYSAPSSWGISGVKYFLSNGQRDDAIICGKIIFGELSVLSITSYSTYGKICDP